MNKWQAFLGDLANQLAASSAVLSLHSNFGRHAPVHYRHGACLQGEDSLQSALLPIDHAASSRDGQILAGSDLKSFTLGVDLHDHGQLCARLWVTRARATGDFRVEDRELLQLLVPHLRSAIAMRTRVDEASIELAHCSDALDKLAMGAVIVNRHGRVLFASQLALSILREHDGVSLVDDRLEFRDREDSKLIKHLIGQALGLVQSAGPGKVLAARLRGAGMPDLRLIVRALGSRASGNDPLRAQTAAIFMSVDVPRADASDIPGEMLRSLFGLTPKEAELALKLAGGLSLQEASVSLNISPNTARAHLRSIFSKTGIDRQTKLVRTLLRSVAMLGG